MKQPKVSIIILNYNGLTDTIECLESLKKITYPNYDTIVVDNDSAGDDVKVLREKYGNYLHIVENDKNYGFAGGNNIGMRYALTNSNPDYLLLLNNDTIVDPEFVTEMVKVTESDPAIGAAVAKIYLYHKPNRFEAVGSKINMWRGQCFRIGWMRKDTEQYEKLRELDAAAANSLLITKGVIQNVGFFDESYFIYLDDADYCVRVRRAGYKIVYVPKAKIWHKVGASARRVTGLPYYYLARNNFRFMRQHATKWQYRCFLAYFLVCHLWLMTGAYLIYFRSLRVLLGFYRGVRDGLFNSTAAAKFYGGN